MKNSWWEDGGCGCSLLLVGAILIGIVLMAMLIQRSQ